MNSTLFLKACGIWLLMAVLAIANGALRDSWLAQLIGPATALPLSGLSLAGLIFIATWLCFPLIGNSKPSTYWLVGLQWLVMTLLFEFPFGHYVLGKPWPELLQAFDVGGGNLFSLALLASLLAPQLVAKFKGPG